VFIFKYDEVFLPEEIDKNNLEDIFVLKKLIALNINKRLKIK